MQPDGTVDYRSYSYSELKEALALIDAKRYPLNLHNLQAEIAARPKPAPKPSPSPVELQEPPQPPAPISPRDRYRTFWRRLGAGLVDGIVFWPLSWLGNSARPDSWGAVGLILWNTLFSIVGPAYNIYFISRYGATIGKMAFGIKVMNLSEERMPSIGQAVVRDIGNMSLSLFALGYLVWLVAVNRYSTHADYLQQLGTPFTGLAFGWLISEYITMLTNRKRRALHDYIAGTVVVRNA